MYFVSVHMSIINNIYSRLVMFIISCTFTRTTLSIYSAIANIEIIIIKNLSATIPATQKNIIMILLYVMHDVFSFTSKKLEGVTENSVWQVLGEKSKWYFTQKVCRMRRDGEEIKTCGVLLRNIAFGEIDDTKFGICFSFPCTHNQSVEIKYISSLSAILD